MDTKRFLTRFGVAGALALVGSCAAVADAPIALIPDKSPNLVGTHYGLGYAGQQETWNTVLVISAIVGGVGLLTGQDTLLLLGGAGVLLSLVEMNSNHFHMQAAQRGFSFADVGPVSFGLTPMVHPGYSHENDSPRQGGYVQWTIKL